MDRQFQLTLMNKRLITLPTFNCRCVKIPRLSLLNRPGIWFDWFTSWIVYLAVKWLMEYFQKLQDVQLPILHRDAEKPKNNLTTIRKNLKLL